MIIAAVMVATAYGAYRMKESLTLKQLHISFQNIILFSNVLRHAIYLYETGPLQ